MFLFFNGSSSVSESIIYITVIITNSGLTFQAASILIAVYIFVLYTVGFVVLAPGILASYHTQKTFIKSLFYIIFFSCYALFFMRGIEVLHRVRFMAQITSGECLKRQDTLIKSILPASISKALRDGDVNHLAANYPRVTILFCYITDYVRLTSAHNGKVQCSISVVQTTYTGLKCVLQDTVELLSEVVTTFDRIMELTGAYKVENIGDTYMCCSGCPDEVTTDITSYWTELWLHDTVF